MSTDGFQKNFTFSYPDLQQITRNLCDNMTLDIVDFGVFGVSSLAVTNLMSLCDAFEAYKTDYEYETELTIATDNKNALAEQILEQIRNMNARSLAAYEPDEPKLRYFTLSGINVMNDRELLVWGRQVITDATACLSDLAPYGLTVGVLSAFTTLCQNYEDALTAQNHAIVIRQNATKERLDQANELYDKVSTYSNFGKRIYARTNQAKYNNYLLYTGGPSGLPGKIQSLAYNSATAKFTWQADSNATSYQIETSPDGSEWLQIYEGSAAEYVNTQGPGTGIARCRGVNDNGSGSWSDNLDYTVPVPVPLLVSVGFDGGNNRSIVTFDTVAYADLYLIYQSVVPIGNPAGAFDEIGYPTSSPFNTVSANNAMREYYYVKASYNDVLSVQSNIVFLDVPVV